MIVHFGKYWDHDVFSRINIQNGHIIFGHIWGIPKIPIVVKEHMTHVDETNWWIE